MKKIHLLRHGHTEGNEKKLYYGRTDIPLSPGGRERLRQMLSRGGYPAAAGCRVYISGMARTEETLRILYGDLPHEVVPGLREMDFGDFEMQSYEMLKDRADFQLWMTGNSLENVCPGGESPNQMAARAVPAFEALAGRGEDALVVCHGGVIAVIMAHLFHEEKTIEDWIPEPGEGYTILWDGAGKAYEKIPDLSGCGACGDWHGKSYAFFANRDCEYFPCHKTEEPENFSCLFCYCPLYALGDRCGGDVRYTASGVKDCGDCLLPHRRENYGQIVSRLKETEKK